MRVHVLFHDHCFDGVASAATFGRFYRERVDSSAELSWRGLTHRAGTCWTPDVWTDAPVHACVDFRYSASPRLAWWFDHHQSAFETPEDEAHFRADRSGRKFHDPTAKSCTRFLARTAAERFGFDPSPLSELVRWAEIVDGAQFPDAHTAVALEEPALRLMLLVEATTDPGLIPRLADELSRRTLGEVVAEPFVRDPLEPLFRAHSETVRLVRERSRLDRGVVVFDLSDRGVDNFNKFIAYEQHPQARYCVAVSAGRKRAKVSVGSNPWAVQPRTHNIAAICESYGGGGHPAVGAVSFPPDRIDDARRAAAEIAEKLKE